MSTNLLPNDLPNAGVPGPIPEDFDFDPFVSPPAFVSRFELPLMARIAANYATEAANNASIAQTIAVKHTPVPRPVDLDIGPPLKPLYGYSQTEFNELVASEQVCQSLAPLPVGLVRNIAKERANLKAAADSERLAEKAKEKEASSVRNKLLGSMRLTNPTPRVMARAEAVTIPSIYLLGLKNGACPPLNFFTNERIEAVTHSHSEVHTRMLRPFRADEALSAEKVQLLDLPKMISIWGSDDKHTCLTPMRFKEASKNFLAALTLVSEAPSTAEDGSSVPTFASEYQKHFDFFDQLRDFEETYPIWYRFELAARRDILKGILFDWDVYTLEVKMLLHSNLPQPPASSAKRPIEADNRLSKFPRNSFRTDVSSCSRATEFSQYPTELDRVLLLL
ncbi:hypothetical protein LshimejAT787_0902800 [Lyophyllum shimeji]|uniref:Uncharacterized protein n=1 Tax=Lyophyllum shimeji TaxID=47721 RepID=A0A9P3UR91_LYOSH|nr:hypothetical protein LshimejAT787_0902800 [Lyophyllum shimeji]